MSEPMTESAIAECIEHLVMGTARDHKVARDRLIELGLDAVKPLAVAFRDGDAEMRYETLRIIAEIGDPATAKLLVWVLGGKDEDLAFVAAEGLVALEADAVDPLLSALAQPEPTAALRDGAARVLTELAHTELRPMLDDLAMALAAGDEDVSALASGALDQFRGWLSSAAA